MGTALPASVRVRTCVRATSCRARLLTFALLAFRYLCVAVGALLAVSRAHPSTLGCLYVSMGRRRGLIPTCFLPDACPKAASALIAGTVPRCDQTVSTAIWRWRPRGHACHLTAEHCSFSSRNSGDVIFVHCAMRRRQSECPDTVTSCSASFLRFVGNAELFIGRAQANLISAVKPLQGHAGTVLACHSDIQHRQGQSL